MAETPREARRQVVQRMAAGGLSAFDTYKGGHVAALPVILQSICGELCAVTSDLESEMVPRVRFLEALADGLMSGRDETFDTVTGEDEAAHVSRRAASRVGAAIRLGAGLAPPARRTPGGRARGRED